MLLGEIRQGTDSAGRCSLHWLSVPWAGLGKKGCSCPAHSLQIGWISGGLCSRPGRLLLTRPPPAG